MECFEDQGREPKLNCAFSGWEEEAVQKMDPCGVNMNNYNIPMTCSTWVSLGMLLHSYK